MSGEHLNGVFASQDPPCLILMLKKWEAREFCFYQVTLWLGKSKAKTNMRPGLKYVLDKSFVCLTIGTLGYRACWATRSILDLFGIICSDIGGGELFCMALVLRLCHRNYVFEIC